MITRNHRPAARTALSLSLHVLACTGVALALFAPHVRARDVAVASVAEHWSEYRLAGATAGYVLERADGRKTHVESKIVLNRMGSRVEIGGTTDYDEDADGRLRGLRAETSMSREKTTLRLDVEKDAFVTVSEAGGKTYRNTQPLTAPLYGPQGVRKLSRERLVKAGDTLDYATFVAEAGGVSNVVRKVLRRESVDVGGRRVEAVVVNEVQSVLPVPSTLWLDADGRVVRQEQRSPFGEVVVLPGTSALRATVEAGATLPEDTYQNAVARSNLRLPRPRTIERVVLRIDLKNADGGMPDVSGPNQRVLERSDRHAVVEVTRPAEPDGAQSPRTDAGYVAANAVLQSDHADVRTLALSLKRPGASAWQQARVLQDWVSENMQFDAGVALVSASEVVRDRSGTCVAYAVLLTSLARALDIPSRLVMGYVYAGNMWGGHAWTEIRVGDAWVPLDAAMYAPGVADAARFAVVRLSENGDSAAMQTGLAQLFGNERIRVLSYTVDGRKVDVADPAVPYAIDGDRFRNAALGFAVRKPSDATFTQLDAMYPDMTVVAVRAADGREVVVQQGAASVVDLAADGLAAYLKERGYGEPMQTLTVAGRPALLARKVDAEKKVTTTAIAFRDAQDMWLVRTTGDDGDVRVRAVAAGVELASAAVASR